MFIKKVYQDVNGNISSSRVIGLAVIGNALLMLWSCIVFGFIHPDQFVAVIGIGTGLFTGVSTGTFVYLYSSKKVEPTPVITTDPPTTDPSEVYSPPDPSEPPVS